jgi:hypothetical protein
MNDDSVLALHQARAAGWAIHQLGKAVMVSSFVGLIAALVIGLFALPVAGLVCGWYLMSSSPPIDKETKHGEARPFVADE